MPPSPVRSKTAPHSCSSRTRSGASWACNWAMRHWLRNFPPRIVSRKWTCQLSRASALANAAAIPPSAMTVWALPRSDLQTRAVRAPSPEASIAARSPAPPAPMTSTSYSCCSYLSMFLEESDVRDPARRDQPYVEVGEGDRKQAGPGPEHVVLVEGGDPRPQSVAELPGGGAGESVESPPDQVPERMTRGGVDGQERGVDG